jgi:hypothetical protein
MIPAVTEGWLTSVGALIGSGLGRRKVHVVVTGTKRR